MISSPVGTNLKKSTKPIIWWTKLGVALILSNVLFFFLFSPKKADSGPLPTGWVEMQIKAELLTPYHSGKRILLINRSIRKKIEALLMGVSPEEEKLTVVLKEEDASFLLQHGNWEVIPFFESSSILKTTI